MTIPNTSERGAGVPLGTLLVPTFTHYLGALAAWLDKADAQLPAGEAQSLLSARLAPDMFPLSTQIRFACVQVHEAVARLTGVPFSATVDRLLEEGRSAAERPGTLDEARARIAEALGVLDGLRPGDLDADPAAMIVHDLPNGMTFDFTALQYARDWAIGQFMFHVMTAYAILRSHGVELGKADYVGHLLPFLRTP